MSTDDLFRGHSLSEGRPVATGEISYDHSSGAYAGIAIAGVATRDDGVQFLSLQENLGYAHNLRPGVSVDLGIVGYTYGKSYSGKQQTTYFEPYIGILRSQFSAYLYYAPDYLSLGQATIYADVEANRTIAPHLRVNLHFGVLAPIGNSPSDPPIRSQYDWRAGVSIDHGAFGVGLSVAGLGPRGDYYADQYHGRSTVVVKISRIF